MTVKEATAIVREYFREQCVESGLGAYFTFSVNGAVENALGYFEVYCSHLCGVTRQHHRVLVDVGEGKILAVEKREDDGLRP